MSNTIIDNVDAVIIGAGIMGLSTAYYLSKQGLKVCIVERESYIGGYTTMRCAGGIRQQFSSWENIMLSKLNRKLMRELEEESQCSIQFIPCGYSFAFTEEKSLKEIEEAVKLQREMEVNAQILTSKQTASMFGKIRVDDVLLTTYCRDDGLLNVSMLLGIIKRELHKRNVKILCNKTVCGIEAKNGKINKVILDEGEIVTSLAINAAGPFAKEIGKLTDTIVPIEPSLQQVWVTEPVSWINKDMPVIIFGDEGTGFHWESGGILSGYSRPYQKEQAPFAEIDPDWEIKHCKKAVERVPDLYDKKLISKWAGFYETTIDDLPIVGPYGPSGMYCIAGFNGHGITQGLACGYILSYMITGKQLEVDISSLSYFRFHQSVSVKTGYKI